MLEAFFEHVGIGVPCVLTGVIADLLRMAGTPATEVPAPAASAPVTKLVPGRRYLHVKLSGGRAFVESLIDEDIQTTPTTLTLCLQVM